MGAGATLVLWVVASALLLCVFNSAAVGVSPAIARFEFVQPHMGTTARVVLYTDTASNARVLADRAFARIAEIDSRLSDYRPDSELMALCRVAGGASVTVGADLYNVLSAARRVSELTAGAFDITVGPISRLWRRARVTGEPPSAASLSAARALVGYEQIDLSPPSNVRLAKPGMLLDLGGIAKGYAADQALGVLHTAGVSSALVALGGDIVVRGAPPGKDGWTIAIAPLGPAVDTNIGPLLLRDAAVSTSGDAEQYVVHDGTRYSHLLNPATGRALAGRRGVTVRAYDGMTADALATGISVLGRERGLAVADLAGAAALIVESAADGVHQFRSSRW